MTWISWFSYVISEISRVCQQSSHTTVSLYRKKNYRSTKIAMESKTRKLILKVGPGTYRVFEAKGHRYTEIYYLENIR